MTGIADWWLAGDAVIRGTSALLVLMSIAAWVVIVCKLRLLRRVRRDLPQALAVFWQSADWHAAREQLAAIDRERVVRPLVEAARAPSAPAQKTIESDGSAGSQVTRRLRDALQDTIGRLQFGQTLLASVGSTAPFVGLFGTVWGVYRALAHMAASTALSLDRVAGPVGESLVMTAAGLVVAVPAVLAYNVFGKVIAAHAAKLEGFAHDLREWVASER